MQLSGSDTMFCMSALSDKLVISAATAVAAIALGTTTTLAAWPGDPTVNVPICTALEEQSLPAIASDGAGGAIITWHDTRGGDERDIYAQRVSFSGEVLWTADGVAICTADNDQRYPRAIHDGQRTKA